VASVLERGPTGIKLLDNKDPRRMGEARQRRPTKNANRFVYNGPWASHVSCSCFTLRQVWQNTRRMATSR